MRPLINSDDSDEGDDHTPAKRMAARARLTSDEEESDLETGGSEISEWSHEGSTDEETTTEEEHEDGSGTPNDESSTAVVKEVAGTSLNDDSSSSDDGDPESPKCSICLLRLSKSSEIGQPDGGCNHYFCYECIKEWSKNVATCPIDRGEFRRIIVRGSVDGAEIRRERVTKGTDRDASNLEEDTPILLEDGVVCESCGSGDREDSLLLCDGCDLGFHLECLVPSLTRVPMGLWYCVTCEAAGLISSVNRRRCRRPRITSDDEEEIDDDLDGFIVSDDVLDDGVLDEEDPISLVLPRTLQTVRVRRAVQNRRNAENLVSNDSGPSPAKKKSKKKTTRKTTRKKTKTASKGSGTKWKSSRSRKFKSKRVKRKGRSKKASKKGSSSSSSSMKNEGRRGLEVPGPTLSMFGNPDDLDYFSNDDDAAEDPKPSTSGFGSTLGQLPPIATHSKASYILSLSSSGSPSKPVALVKPFQSDSGFEKSGSLLDAIMTSQRETFKSEKPNRDKRPEVYTKPTESGACETKIISTSVSRQQLYRQTLPIKRGKTCDPSKVKSSSKVASSPSYMNGGGSSQCRPGSPVKRKAEATDQIFTAKRMKNESSSFRSEESRVGSGADRKPPRTEPKVPNVVQRDESERKTVAKTGEKPRSYADRERQLLMFSAMVKHHLKPFFARTEVSKDQYKAILKGCVEEMYRDSKKPVETGGSGSGIVASEKVATLVHTHVRRHRMTGSKS